jgi:hypothetical protein
MLSSLNPSTTVRTDKKRMPYAQFKQYGCNNPQPHANREALREYKRVAERDLTIRTCFDILLKTIMASVDRVVHEDPEIADHCNYQLAAYEDEHGTNWQSMLSNPIHSLWEGGFSTSEVMLSKGDFSRILLSDLVTYDPVSIQLYPDPRGRLIESKSSYYNSRIPSGIYQTIRNYDPTIANLMGSLGNSYSTLGMIRLPRKKVVYLKQHGLYGNHYGISSIAPIYRWVLLKEAFIDMMSSALDRYGNPLFYIAMPDLPTDLTETDDEGMARAITTFDTLRSQLQNLGSQGNALLLPYVDKGVPPKIGQISQPQNIGSVFIDSIEYCNAQIALELGVPTFFILSRSSLETNNRAIPEHLMTSFWANIDDYRSKIVNAICRQIFAKVIDYNFDNRPTAKRAPTFSRVYSNRAEDRVATMQVVQGLTKAGALNPQVQTDFDIMRQMVGLPTRDMNASDRDLFERLYESNAGGRPVGSTKPQQKARAKTSNKPTGDLPIE